ncbi:MAG: hypothetical protein K1X86_00455 [Ignavibacteria bacterium]|nr:hypothetical protein [Ignavibacteria bacterium]
MNPVFEKAKQLSENGLYDDALKILLELEKSEKNKATRIEILKNISNNYKEAGEMKLALEYHVKFSDEEHDALLEENKEKTESLNSSLKIHQSQKENLLLLEKNEEFLKANNELNELRGRKNDLLKSISKELKFPIEEIKRLSRENGDSLKKALENKDIQIDLEKIETLSQQVLDNVNNILKKNKEEFIQ